jgi:hypothetical protein
MEFINRRCEGCNRPITLLEWEDGRWRAFNRPFPTSHSCPEYRALQAQRLQRERRVLPTERHARRYEQPARRHEQPARRSTVGWPEERRSPTFLARHKTELQSGLSAPR